MVTLAEFLQHVIVSGVVMAVGLAAVAFTRFRYDTGHKTFRRFAWWFVGLLVLIALLSAFVADVTNIRCPGDPANVCRFNDTVPAMATIAFVYLLAGLWRSRTMYTWR